jgi:hypothetical protein
MGTPKKPVKKKISPKSNGEKKPAGQSVDPVAKKRVIDEDDEDEDFDVPMDELEGYESFDEFEEDDDF